VPYSDGVKRSLLALSFPCLCGLVVVAGQSCAAKGKISATPGDSGAVDATAPPSPGSFCALPGSVVWSAAGSSVVPGGDASTPDLSWLTVPAGFCVHYFATLGDVRQMRFAPGGDLFATSPTTATAGGNSPAGLAMIAVLPDDDGDGVADSTLPYMSNLPSTQGFMFANDALYYQDGPVIHSVAFQPGDRAPSAQPQVVTTITAPQDELHWTKVMDIAQDGTIYITNGGSQEDECLSTDPTLGSIWALADGGTTTLVAKGFRNPIAMRCEADHDVCLAVELALDYSMFHYGREKIVPVRAGDNWGFPCCATADLPYEGVIYHDTGAAPDCSGVTAETDSFVIGQTPFGLDFETGKWPAPWTGRVFVTLHGASGSWLGAQVVAASIDPDGGMPLPASDLDLDGGPTPTSLLPFATGWDDGKQDHGRPAPIAFAPDGRVFVGDDYNGVIVWMAPIGLARP
jgi:glucose/arabinose dehydrogenase